MRQLLRMAAGPMRPDSALSVRSSVGLGWVSGSPDGDDVAGSPALGGNHPYPGQTFPARASAISLLYWRLQINRVFRTPGLAIVANPGAKAARRSRQGFWLGTVRTASHSAAGPGAGLLAARRDCTFWRVLGCRSALHLVGYFHGVWLTRATDGASDTCNPRRCRASGAQALRRSSRCEGEEAAPYGRGPAARC